LALKGEKYNTIVENNGLSTFFRYYGIDKHTGKEFFHNFEQISRPGNLLLNRLN